MKKNKIFIALFMIIAFSCKKQEVIIDTGVSIELANFRKENIENIHYDLFFDIPLEVDESIDARVDIKFTYQANDPLQIDFKEEKNNINSIIVNGDTIDIELNNEHIIIPAKNLSKENTVSIDFTAGNLSLNRNKDYLYTLFVPARARTVFPLFDQPNLKAKYSLILEIPEQWKGFSNGSIQNEQVNQGRKQITFKETHPISSYLFAFGVGEFNQIQNDVGDMIMYYRESDEEKVARNAIEIFDLHRKSLNWLEDYTGIPYPFEKFDFALIPTFQYGGMEHPGSIFYRESALMLGESASINQQLRRAGLIAHETAHMWFGDLVTMDWFDDVWLKEVFANFYAAKIVNPGFPEVNHDLRFLLSHYPRAYTVDRTKGSHPIQQELDNLDNAGSLYGAIIYQKAPIVMRNLEDFIGKEKFREGIQTYLEEFSYGNAKWDDLISILSSRTNKDLKKWNNDWVKSPGMPTIQIAFEDNLINISSLVGDQNQFWSQNFEYINGDNSNVLELGPGVKQVSSGDQFFSNSNGYTYGYIQLNDELLENQLLDLSIKDEVARASAWMTQWENVLNENKDPKILFEQLFDGISVEYNSLILNYQLQIFGNLYWNYLSEDKRNELSESAEEMLFEKMMKTADKSVKRVLYNGFKNISISDNALTTLENIWNDELHGFSLPLSENDKISLAYELMLKESKNCKKIMNEQFANTKNQDNLRRLAFVAPSVSNQKEVRDSVFNSLMIAENRSIEPWVNQAIGHLHHPLRRQESLSYILPSLEIIEDIKDTGDIFFPSSWLSATLSNHNSDEALNIVHKFFEENENLPPDLEKKLLQAADNLERSHNLLSKGIKG